MTAVASSLAPIVNADLANTILRLPEEDFWKLVYARLNLPQQQQDQIIIVTDVNEEEEELSSHIEYWTEECLIDELFLQLASTKQTILHNDKSIMVYKYYHQALTLRKSIAIAEPTPEFVVNLSDLNARIISELKTLGDPYYVLIQAVGRIFENIDFRQYHISVARKLKVRLSK